ncbi:hypothetical protein Q3G72_026296 [Acer saccharum]|nr:hypothetical protein Q3G72_026296 [Acer saccharum]
MILKMMMFEDKGFDPGPGDGVGSDGAGFDRLADGVGGGWETAGGPDRCRWRRISPPPALEEQIEEEEEEGEEE